MFPSGESADAYCSALFPGSGNSPDPGGDPKTPPQSSVAIYGYTSNNLWQTTNAGDVGQPLGKMLSLYPQPTGDGPAVHDCGWYNGSLMKAYNLFVGDCPAGRPDKGIVGYLSRLKHGDAVPVFQTKPTSPNYPNYELSILWGESACGSGTNCTQVGFGPAN